MEEQETDLIELSGRPRRRVRPVAVAGVALVALAAGGGVGYTAIHHSTPAATTTALSAGTTPSSSPLPSSSLPRHRGLRFAFGFGFGQALHGQLTVPKAGGGYQTLDVQRGTVTAVSSTSLTVKSSDGYTASYAVNSSTIVDAESAGIGSVKSGDTVFVAATVSGSTATAARVIDTTAVKAGRAHFGFPMAPVKPSAPSS
jgi:hypothetical protein